MPFFSEFTIPQKFVDFYNKALKDKYNFKSHFPNFNIDNKYTKVQIARIILFYIKQIALYKNKYILIRFKSNHFNRFAKHPEYFNASGYICNNDNITKYYICDSLSYTKIKIIRGKDIIPDEKLLEIFSILKFPSITGNYLMLEKSICDIPIVKNETIGIRVKKVQDFTMIDDINLVELFDMRPDEKITLKNISIFLKRMYD